jgi:putative copper export protein
LLLLEKQFLLKWDWFSLIGVSIFSLLSVTGINFTGINDIRIFQYGSYVILIGIIISFVFLIKATRVNK